MLKEGKNKAGKTLTEIQERFCMEYVICNNASKACKLAGYKGNAMATYLLNQKKIQDRITELRNAIVTDDLVSIEYIINGLKEVVNRGLQKVPVMIWNNVTKSVEQERNERGQLVYKFDGMSVNRALELLGRYKGIFEKGNIMKANNLPNKPTMSDEQFEQLIQAALTNNEGQKSD